MHLLLLLSLFLLLSLLLLLSLRLLHLLLASASGICFRSRFLLLASGSVFSRWRRLACTHVYDRRMANTEIPIEIGRWTRTRARSKPGDGVALKGPRHRSRFCAVLSGLSWILASIIGGICRRALVLYVTVSASSSCFCKLRCLSASSSCSISYGLCVELLFCKLRSVLRSGKGKES
jgi:hypothetical protein